MFCKHVNTHLSGWLHYFFSHSYLKNVIFGMYDLLLLYRAKKEEEVIYKYVSTHIHWVTWLQHILFNSIPILYIVKKNVTTMRNQSPCFLAWSW